MRSDSKNYYQILGLEWNASVVDIHKAYRMYAAKFHPDKHQGDTFFEERFKEVKEAHDVLSDVDKRWRYDIRKFGKSKVVRSTSPDYFDRSSEKEFNKKRKFRFEITHLDLYLACFYFINLTAWVILKKNQDHVSPGGLARGLFLSSVSALLIWFFVNGLIELINKRYSNSPLYLLGYLLLALTLAYATLWTTWVA